MIKDHKSVLRKRDGSISHISSAKNGIFYGVMEIDGKWLYLIRDSKQDRTIMFGSHMETIADLEEMSKSLTSKST